MFTDRTYENLLAEFLALAPEGIDTRQGSIYYDAIAACAFKLASFYIDVDCLSDLLFVGTATGEFLDAKGKEYGVIRNPATSARYQYIYKGTTPALGTRFFTDGLYFILQDNVGTLCLVAEEAGEAANIVSPGTPATPVHSIAGLTVSEFGDLLESGAPIEQDKDYRERIQEKIAGPAQNGNLQHYKTWCEEVAGVGRARILPLWAGENTVKGVLLDTEGLPVADTIIERVQEHIDPGGTGLGEGVANIGAHFTAVASKPIPLIISCSIALASGFTLEEAKTESVRAIKQYLKSLALDTPDKSSVVVRMSSLGALLYGLQSVMDYTNLTVNGASANMEIDQESVAVLQEVKFRAIV